MRQLIKMQFGSQVYGTSLPTSDTDYKAVYMPTPRQIILNKARDVIQENTKADITKKSTQDDTEVEIFALKRFIELLVGSQTVPVGMIFVPTKWYVSEPDDIWLSILANKERFLSSGVSAFVGYCRTQANKYGIKGSRVAASKKMFDTLEALMRVSGDRAKLRDHWQVFEDLSQGEHFEIIHDVIRGTEKPVRMISCCDRKAQETVTLREAYGTFSKVYHDYGHRARQAEQNENIDWKALMHACRVYTETKELLATGHVTYPRPDADFLLKVRLGEIPYKQIAEYLESGLDELEGLVSSSVLRKEPDREFAENFIYDAYLKEISNAK